MTAVATPEQEWLDWRRGGIGASDVAGILNLKPEWSSPWSVWANKVGLLPDSEPSAIQERGQMLELAIAPWFEKRTGLVVHGQQQRCEHPELSFARCTLDGLVYDSIDDLTTLTPDELRALLPLGGIEMKTAQKAWDAIPPHYQAQGQWQMFVRGLERVWFAVFTNWDLHIYELVRDDKDIEFQVERCTEFWERHVLTGEPPAVDGSNATLDAIAAVYPNHVEDKAVALDDRRETYRNWQAAKLEVEAQQAIANQHKAELMAAMADAEVGTLDGERVLTLRAQSRSSVSAKALKAQHPRIAKKLITTTTYRVLREVGQKGADE